MSRQETRQAGNSNVGNRGFASMDKDTQREVASKGGKAAQAGGNSHKFSSAEAREAGKKGGQNRSQGSARDLDPDLDEKVGSEIDQAAASTDYQGREQGDSDVEGIPSGTDVERNQGSSRDGGNQGQGRTRDDRHGGGTQRGIH